MPEIGQQLRPDLNVAIFYSCKTGVDVALLRVGLDAREGAIEKSGVGFVLPVVLERMNVGLCRGAHASNMTESSRGQETPERPSRD